ncbi:MAG: GlcNAc-PI de-N-acetylase [Candidatus Woesearchaeota archaeon]|nr:MAG: GlcNAc-PI de-N-acetylase [Candidatus Woesearchaeota archaeon]
MVYKKEVNLKNMVIVISPHPDDETLGAGGTLLKHKDNGDYIFWINITNMKEEYGYTKEKVKQRNKEIEKVIRAYNFADFFDLAYKPTSLTEADIPTMIERISKVLEKVKPNILYIPFYADAHSDHRIVFKSLQPFFKSFRYPYIKKILMMEIISETDNQFIESFRPNVFIDITDYIDKKLEIMKIYQSEIDKHPFPRSLENIKNFAFYRGSQCGCEYAESFMLLKEVL